MESKVLFIHFKYLDATSLLVFINTIKKYFHQDDWFLRRMYDFEADDYTSLDDYGQLSEKEESTDTYKDRLKNTYTFKVSSLFSDEKIIALFKSLPFIEYVAFDQTYSIDSTILSDGSISVGEGTRFDEVPQWNLDNIRFISSVIELKAVYPVIIAMIDTGVQEDHPDIQGSIDTSISCYWDKQSESLKQGSPDDRRDTVNHGTGVAGIIGAIFNQKGTVGVASQIKIMNIKVVDSDNTFATHAILKGIVLAANKGAKVINISWGLIKRTDDIVKFFNDAIDYAANKSVTVVFSAGNSNQDAKLEVPNWEKTIVVGGLDRSNSKTVSSKFKGSNWGDALTFSAPANGFTIMNNSGKYAKGAGTTLAAPHVTGLIGLMYALKGNLTLKYIKDTIAVNPINYTRDNDKYMGKGIVDVSKTIAQITRNNQSFTNNQKFFKMKDQGVQHFFDLIRDNLASYPTRKNVIDTIVQELVGGPGHCEKWCYDGSKLICCDKAHTQNLICIPVSGANIMLYDSGGALLAYEVLPVEEGFKQYKVIRKKGRKGIKKIVLELYGQTNTIILDIPI